MAKTYLDDILAWHRSRAAGDRREMAGLIAEARSCPPPRGFIRAVRSSPHMAVIAEIKRRSPSKGGLAPSLDPSVLAPAYQAGGATCLSVLTDAEFFGGSAADLRAARESTSIPVIRKDFTIDGRDVCDARIMGADCVLLIAAALTRAEIRDFVDIAAHIDIDVLVEVHDEEELDLALSVGVTMVGVNQRDLVTFAVDHERALRMASLIPEGIVKVAESGVRGRDDALALRRAGYDAILVGEHLVTSADPGAAVTELCVE